jgi:hypothetical protein
VAFDSLGYGGQGAVVALDSGFQRSTRWDDGGGDEPLRVKVLVGSFQRVCESERNAFDDVRVSDRFRFDLSLSQHIGDKGEVLFRHAWRFVVFIFVCAFSFRLSLRSPLRASLTASLPRGAAVVNMQKKMC